MDAMTSQTSSVCHGDTAPEPVGRLGGVVTLDTLPGPVGRVSGLTSQYLANGEPRLRGWLS